MTTCCAPSVTPSAASYKRHQRAGTVPCRQSLADAAAYRLARLRATRTELHEATPQESGEVGTLCLRNALGYAEEQDWAHALALLDEARIWLTAATR